jgi:hypothetical protein
MVGCFTPNYSCYQQQQEKKRGCMEIIIMLLLFSTKSFFVFFITRSFLYSPTLLRAGCSTYSIPSLLQTQKVARGSQSLFSPLFFINMVQR